jgi:hypothetical protein
MKLTKKKAIELSIKKWEIFVNNDGFYNNLFEILPEVEQFPGNCAFCELYNSIEKQCKGCPIRPDFHDYTHSLFTGCFQDKHPYNIWLTNKTKENAQAVLDLIIEKTSKTKKDETN